MSKETISMEDGTITTNKSHIVGIALNRQELEQIIRALKSEREDVRISFDTTEYLNKYRGHQYIKSTLEKWEGYIKVWESYHIPTDKLITALEKNLELLF